MRGLSFRADGELFTVDVILVMKVVRNMAFTPIPAAPSAVVGIANMKGRIVTVLSLAELLGRERGARAVNAVIFKPLTDGNDQMGLLIDKPGDLIEINENEILPPPKTADEEESRCISGITEIDGILYRIINIDSIISRFKDNGENNADAMS